MITKIFWAFIPIFLLMIPMAVQDFRRREISTWLLAIFVIFCIILAGFDNAFTVGLWFGISLLSILLAFMLFLFKKLKPADTYLVIATIWALSFLGALAFLVLLGAVFAYGTYMKGSGMEEINELVDGYPFVTLYICCLLFVFALFGLALLL